MPKLIIKGQGERPSVFFLEPGITRVGRGEVCELRLPNVSVSREHFRIHLEGRVARLVDAGSSNGTLLDGFPVSTVILQSGQEISVGRYRLVYMADTDEGRFYNGFRVDYLPAWSPSAKAAGPASSGAESVETFALSVDALRKMAEVGHLVDTARIVSAEDPSRFWRPGDRMLTFGDSSATVRTLGLFTKGVVAELSYEGNKHVLRKRSLFVSVAVGGTQTDEQTLRHGDQIRIGKSRFVYDAPPSRVLQEGRSERVSARDILRPMAVSASRARTASQPPPSLPPKPTSEPPRPPVLPPEPEEP